MSQSLIIHSILNRFLLPSRLSKSRASTDCLLAAARGCRKLGAISPVERYLSYQSQFPVGICQRNDSYVES